VDNKADNKAVMVPNKALTLVNSTIITIITTMVPNKAASVRVNNNKASAVPVEESMTLNDLVTAINPAAVSVKATSAPLERKPPRSAVTMALPHLTLVPNCTIEAEDNTTTLKFSAQLERVLELALAQPRLDDITTTTELASVNKDPTTTTLASDLATLMALASVNKVNMVNMATMVNMVNKVNWANKVN
jgi:hypothetical protein